MYYLSLFYVTFVFSLFFFFFFFLDLEAEAEAAADAAGFLRVEFDFAEVFLRVDGDAEGFLGVDGDAELWLPLEAAPEPEADAAPEAAGFLRVELDFAEGFLGVDGDAELWLSRDAELWLSLDGSKAANAFDFLLFDFLLFACTVNCKQSLFQKHAWLNDA